jgi:hypothetical protein
MENQTFLELLVHLHHSLDRVTAELADRPDLARALRRRAAWIPRPEDLAKGKALTEPGVGLKPVLYQALEEGAVDAKEFDKLMLREECARREVKRRR